jgi:hypothetical protein
MYDRFVERLGRYPIFDLESDFLSVVLGHEHDSHLPCEATTGSSGDIAELASLRHQLDAIRNSTSWRVTAPLRTIGHRVPRLRRLTARRQSRARSND